MENKKESKGKFASFDIKVFIKQCFKSWKLMGACVLAVCALAAAYLYLRKPSAQVFAQLMLPPETNSSSLLPYLDIASSLPMGDMFGSSSTENEIAVIKSHTVFERTARELGLNVSYLQKRYPLKWYSAYANAQLKLTTLPSIPDTITVTLRFDVDPNDDGTFDIVCKYKRRKLAKVENAQLPVTLNTEYGPFTISKTDFFGKAPVIDFRIFFCSYDAAAYSYNQAVEVYAPSKKTDFIDLSFVTNDSDFGKKLLNRIIDNYNLLGNKYRDENSTRTLDFVNKRLASLEAELAQAEGKMTKFKKSKDIVNPEIDVATLVGKETSLDAQILSVETELEILKMAKDFLSNPDNKYALLPTIPGGGSEMSAYNELILRRMQLVTSAKDNNLTLRKLNEQIDALRANIIVAVNRTYENTSLRLANLRKENAGTVSRKSNVPQMEQEYISLNRDVYLLQQLYMVLLKQREDAEMSMMKTSVSLFTVDAPYVVPKSTEMSAMKVLAVAVFMGLCAGMALLLFIKIPKSPIETAKQIEELSQAPVLATIISEPGEGGIVSADSAAAESVRMLRSNAMYALESIGKNVILVTSATNAEGATWSASNLAVSLAKAGYKTALVEANLRSPRLRDLFPHAADAPTLVGILSGRQSADLASPEGEPALICGGRYDGNPADLLGSEAMSKFVGRLSGDFDYVVIDAAHMQGYSDVFAMAEDADLTLIVAKVGVTTPREMHYVNGVYAEGRLPRIACVVTGVEG